MEISRRKMLSGASFLSFVLGGDEYCIPIGNVKEIRGMTTITKLPQTPAFIQGVINLRGQIVPVVDLRLRFGMDFLDYHERSTIIVVEVEALGQKDYLGVVVDQIRDVVSIPDEQVKAIPYVQSKVKTEYIQGIAELGDRIMIVLNITKILSEEEYVLIHTLDSVETPSR